MPRPRRLRRVLRLPEINFFKPAGVRIADLEEVLLSVDEYEAIRLKDFEELNQMETAKKIGVSQPTLNRLLADARKKISDAIVNGKAIRIEGGDYKVVGRKRRWRGGK